MNKGKNRAAVLFSIMLVTIAAMGLIGGVLLQRFGAKKLIRLAGLMWGLGWFLTGCSTSIPMLYLTFGILAGSASGFGYTPGVVTAVGWYPDKKGFASGMAVGVCGMASLVIAPLANFLLNVFNVMTAFKIMGILFRVLMLATSWYIDTPPAAQAALLVGIMASLPDMGLQLLSDRQRRPASARQAEVIQVHFCLQAFAACLQPYFVL